MALVLGTNCGFVTTAPTADPNATGSVTINNTSRATKDTSAADATRIIEMGFYCNSSIATEGNFEVGLYSDAGAGEPETRLYINNSNSTGTDAGWKVVTGLNWNISPNTIYWLAIECDGAGSNVNMDWTSNGGSGVARLTSQTTLPSDWGTSAAKDPDDVYAIYAVYETSAPSGTNQWINVDDAYRQVTEAWVNVDDSWRKVKEAWINVDDVWRKLYSV
ncbi:hypothetical protein M0R04_15740 [Candidatus Dojkabacteria bacterium]|jgi:hypothetical protein|nr:hypothetical protein [Candidatus Dojkabacteria bacterium]